MTERALIFGTAAEAYERHRLGYPEAVADLVLAYAQPPVERALEVGAGTGKATLLLARRGIAVTACEPDPAMAEVLRRTTAGFEVEVEVALSTYETYETSGTPVAAFDLLFAASAWHWTDPVTRWDRTAALLRSGGTVALFGSGRQGSSLTDPELQAAVVEVRSEVIPDERRATDRQAGGMWWPGYELEADDRFTDVQEHDVDRVVRRTRAEHLAVLGTVSSYLQLAPEVREGLVTRIGERLPDEVDVDAAVRVHMARRV